MTRQHWLLITFLTALLAACSDRVGAYKQLINRNATMTANVASTDCGDHGRADYEFVARGQTYTGHTYRLGVPCKDIVAGRALTVYYDPQDPTVNSNMQPADAYAYHRGQLMNKVYFGLFLIAAFAIGRFRRGR